ncbi:hypothetical protein P7K49_004663, partial [Saguinus oedipus]
MQNCNSPVKEDKSLNSEKKRLLNMVGEKMMYMCKLDIRALVEMEKYKMTQKVGDALSKLQNTRGGTALGKDDDFIKRAISK